MIPRWARTKAPLKWRKTWHETFVLDQWTIDSFTTLVIFVKVIFQGSQFNFRFRNFDIKAVKKILIILILTCVCHECLTRDVLQGYVVLKNKGDVYKNSTANSLTNFVRIDERCSARIFRTHFATYYSKNNYKLPAVLNE